eukprot:TRINITY_DN2624_c0_g1_i1.p1 TRINITY_DN2624_c0_g1~~TRINITY_DN2624_c0_g1_i1.p1  ORF type:complete len:339 (+),score=91.32 TRINITY_DN2624_c0_g1_i1:90-1106(+)
MGYIPLRRGRVAGGGILPARPSVRQGRLRAAHEEPLDAAAEGLSLAEDIQFHGLRFEPYFVSPNRRRQWGGPAELVTPRSKGVTPTAESSPWSSPASSGRCSATTWTSSSEELPEGGSRKQRAAQKRPHAEGDAGAKRNCADSGGSLTPTKQPRKSGMLRLSASAWSALNEVQGLPGYTDRMPRLCSTFERLLVDVEHNIPSSFDAPQLPTEGVTEFVVRLCWANSHPTCFVRMVIYVDRLLEALGTGNGDALPLTLRNAHRMVLASFVVACKLNDDKHLTNERYAQLGKVSLQDMNRLEKEVLVTLDWHLEVDPDEEFRPYDQKFAPQATPEAGCRQ